MLVPWCSDSRVQAFSDDSSKQAQWAGFVRKSRLQAPSLAEVVEVAAVLANEAFDRAREGQK